MSLGAPLRERVLPGPSVAGVGWPSPSTMMAARPPPTTDDEPAFFSRQIWEARRFSLNLRPNRRSPLAVVCGGWERCTLAYEVRREGFPFFAVELVGAGEVTVELGGQSYDLQPGSVFAYGPGVPHRLRAGGQRHIQKYFVGFVGTRALPLLQRVGLPPGTVRHVADPLVQRELLDVMISVGLRRTADAPAICASILEAFLCTLRDSSIEPAAREPASLTTYRRCRALVEARSGEIRTLDEAARLGHVTPSYLCRLFGRYARESPYQMIQRLRMQRAAALLNEPGAMVKNVAAELGFADPFHFSHAFKRQFGVPPTQIAKRTSKSRRSR